MRGGMLKLVRDGKESGRREEVKLGGCNLLLVEHVEQRTKKASKTETLQEERQVARIGRWRKAELTRTSGLEVNVAARSEKRRAEGEGAT
jgi:hypothetical protein